MGNFPSQSLGNDAPNQQTVKENNTIKGVNRSIKDKTHRLKNWMEELDRDVDIFMALMKKKEEQIQQLESHNKNLAIINEQLNMEMKAISSKSPPHQDRKTNQVKAKHFETKWNNGGRSEDEIVISCQLRDSLETKDQLWDPQRNKDILKPLEVPLTKIHVQKSEKADVLPEWEETKPVDDSLPRAKQPKFLFCFQDPLKLLLAIALCLGLCTGVILTYAYYFSNSFIANSLPLLFSDHDIAELTQLLSPYLTWKNNGLLPF